jgi:TusA-related sulfurtransferase
MGDFFKPEVSPINWTLISNSTRYFSCQQSFLGLRDLCINRNNHLCPMPVIRLWEMIEKIEIGDTIQIIATDPGVLHDIPAWCKVHGHKATLHPLGDFLNPALTLLGQGLKKSPIGQKLDFSNHPYL